MAEEVLGAGAESVEYDWRPAFELMLEESRRSIDRQMQSVREARQRAGSLLGYASVLAAALGFSVDGSLGASGGVAVASFLVVAFTAMAVLYPRKFSQDLAAGRIEAWFDHPANTGVDHMLRSAALAHEENYESNERSVVWIHRGIMTAVGGLVVETVALVARLML
ncbi:hypothetical protein BH11ACT8_BH11ACT8_02440 [soil metagenome]